MIINKKLRLKTLFITPLLWALLLLLSSCTSLEQQKIVKVITSKNPDTALKSYLNNKKVLYEKSPNLIISDINNLDKTIKKLQSIVEGLWGKDNGQISTNKKYVKYTDNYQSKAQVDFTQGKIKIETIAKKQPLAHLKKAIITTLLTTENPADTDIFSDKEPIFAGKPYLFMQVLDQDNQAIAYQWRANRFADHLINLHLKKQWRDKKLVYYVEVDMVKSHNNLRKRKYAPYVLAAANRYQIKPELIYAIIETESNFNPFAVSHANAYGLMQIIPATAGKDVYQRILNKAGMPTKKTLFTAKENINIGTAYLHILQQQYLKNINNAQSRHYAVISAYNGGAGNVFKTFSTKREKAPSVINTLSSSDVYKKLTKQHPKAESRRYLYKVTTAEKRYQK